MIHLTFIQKLHHLLQENNIDPTGWEIRSLEMVNSTNDTVNDLFLFYDKVVVLATSQTQGRGRDGRFWESPIGGCWLSLGIVKHVPAVELASPVTQSVQNVISKYAPTRIKEPNDILITDKKIAGILVEGKISGINLTQVVIGIGVNVVNEIPDSISNTATSLKDHCDPPNVQYLAAEIACEIIKMLQIYGLD
jgi:BirA family biotin operon repressor/biotin-[acetyl-CoA-carboxylase] ligase